MGLLVSALGKQGHLQTNPVQGLGDGLTSRRLFDKSLNQMAMLLTPLQIRERTVEAQQQGVASNHREQGRGLEPPF